MVEYFLFIFWLVYLHKVVYKNKNVDYMYS